MPKQNINNNIKASAGAQVTDMTLRERISSYICPMLLGGALCFSIIYALYRPAAYPCAIGFLAAEFILFALFDRLKKRPLTGGLLYTMMFVVIEFGAMYFMVSGASVNGSYMNPISWFYGEDGSFSNHPYYLAAVMLGGGFFMISILYYFTQIRYRSLGSMLCILFPFVIYAKRAEEMPELVVTLIVTMFIAVMVHNRRIDPATPKAARGVLRVDLSYIISIALFVTITGSVTMMIDKPKYTSELEKNANFFNYNPTGIGGGNYESLSSTSSKRYGVGRGDNNPLFYFETNGTDEEYYLRSTSFDYFNGDVWEHYSGRDDYSYVYSSVIPEYSYDDIIYDMNELIKRNGSIGNVTSITGDIPVRKARVYDDNFSPAYLPAPYGIITDSDKLAMLDYRKYYKGVVIRKDGVGGGDPPPLNDRFEFMDPGLEYRRYAMALELSGEDYVELLENDGSGNAMSLIDDYMTASDRFMSLDNVSDDVKALAEEITAGAHSDMEKALLLEEYFEENNYKYDPDYVPEDESIDYFIFEGKTGVCSSYATAMTLMARSVGLPARYTEGFAAFEPTDEMDITVENGRGFVVRGSHAHAFVEVYIPGAGWLTFDPTVSDYKNIDDNDGISRGAMLLKIISRLLLVLIVVFSIVFVLMLDRFAELLLRLRLPFMKNDKRVLKLYRHLIWLMNRSTRKDCSPYTAAMIREYLRRTRGCCPDKLTYLFERACFGGHHATAEEWQQAYAEYRRCYRYLRKIPDAKKLEKLKAAQGA